VVAAGPSSAPGRRDGRISLPASEGVGSLLRLPSSGRKRGYLKTSIVDVWLMCPMYSSP